MPPARPIHSLAEAHLYAAMLPCPACSGRGFVVVDVQSPPQAGSDSLILVATCSHCAAERSIEVDLSLCPRELRPNETVRRLPLVLSAHPEPSALIDVSEWLTLYSMAVEAAGQLTTRTLARGVLIEAGECLAEALKFYHAGSDVPPGEAFFSDETLGRFREHPERFARQRLIDLAAELPVPSTRPPAAITLNRPASTKWWLR